MLIIPIERQKWRGRPCPVPGSEFKDLDLRRLQNYFREIRKQECPPMQDTEDWQKLLVNTEFMV
ncbi:MAG: ATP-dependent DNA helicase RecG, partial [Calditrichota bacterium]